jgi:type II secretory pathway component PulF
MNNFNSIVNFLTQVTLITLSHLLWLLGVIFIFWLVAVVILYHILCSTVHSMKYEGHTMLPIVEDFVKRFNLDDFVVVADSGLMNKAEYRTFRITKTLSFYRL